MSKLILVDVFQYGRSEAGGVEHVPPGWSYWVGLVREKLKALVLSNVFLLQAVHFISATAH